FLNEGYDVHVVARAQGEIAPLPGNVDFHAQDLSDWGHTRHLDTIKEATGRIDVLVNNAGMHLQQPGWDAGAQELEGGSGLAGERGGAIVNISSMGGLMALPSAAAYVTAKTAVIGLTRSVAVDGAARGVRCNAVCPGFIDTEMTRAVLEKDPARRAKIEGRI